jgi:hypothetical protein
MSKEWLKALLVIFGPVAVPILLFTIWTWAGEPRNSHFAWHVTLIGLAVTFVR